MMSVDALCHNFAIMKPSWLADMSVSMTLICNKKTSPHHENICTKVTPHLHLIYSKTGGNLGLLIYDKKLKFLHKIICCGDLLESPRGGDSNRKPQNMILKRTNDNYEINLLESGLL